MITDEQVDEIIDVCELDRLHHVKRQMVRDVLAQISSVAMAEDPVREAARELVTALDRPQSLTNPYWREVREQVQRAEQSVREALAQPAPPSLTDDERKAVASLLDRATMREWNRVGKDPLDSAWAKLS